MTTEVTGPTPVGEEPLRRRRRRQTEQDICEAALTLFEEHGVAGCTADDIARAAGVSSRTFFRYAVTKERAALVVTGDIEDAFEQGVAALRPDEPLLPQLEALWVEVLRRHENGRSASGHQLRRLYRLLRAEPSLRGAAVAVDDERRAGFAGALAELTGATPDDPTPAILVETTTAVVRVAMDRWAEQLEAAPEGPEPDLVDLYEQAVAAFRTVTAPGA
ncbi:TetR family transcriptional regulator [Nocardioides sp. ChNu-99]|uniref:TetR/AcrR family transcriptional regulator n=1 Tax=Nocardioides sp. ChNu-99 TaxID=2839897 RepID=UPI00240534BB|nr:TetR family transcriptional regulator [Nocardioides sp. ChNu-99]MDF9714931.1 TetR/AcrR family transcriptional regulator [Nocardioides sp. ChNu-99]